MTNPKVERRTRSRLSALATGVAACFLLTACDTVGDWFSGGDDDATRLPGNRISVLQFQETLEPDPTLASQDVVLPAAVANSEWAQPGGTPAHNLGHVALPGRLSEAWRVSVEGGSSTSPLLSPPIVAGGRVYVLDTDFDLHAFDEATGAEIWTVNMKREDQEGEAFGGGVSFFNGRLFVTTGFGEGIAVDPQDGSVIWRQRIAGPIRSAPTVADGRVFIVATDNQLVTLATEPVSGRVYQWAHTGILEQAALLGGSSVAVSNDTVIVPYSSGELFALRAENGRVAWQDNLAGARQGFNVAALADIRGLPVVDRGVVFAMSHSGRLAAIDERTGRRIWEQDIGGINTPWVAGDWLFVLSNEAQLVALARDTGRVRWITQLAAFEDPDDREDPIAWAGPILAGGRLILVNSEGELVEVSPQTGEIVATSDLPDATFIPPVVANNTLFVLTDDGDLVAYR